MASDKKILVVEDIDIMKNLIERYLQALGYDQIVLAKNGEDALIILKREKIDLIISDWMMPNMDGLTLLKEIRSDEALKDIPFFMATIMDQKEKIAQAEKAGATDYLVKPIDRTALGLKIKKVFAQN
ncbi:MAG: response regulator [Nitrospinales bacterium]